MTSIAMDQSGAERLPEFRRDGYVLVPALIGAALTEFLRSCVDTKFASRLISLPRRGPAAGTAGGYGDPTFDGLLEYLRPRIEAASGLSLYPTYSYFRLYKRGDVLMRHLDRPACEISVTLNLAQSPNEPWPIFVERGNERYAARLSPGDALLYRGCECWHWREAFHGDRLVQVFLHYVDRNGPHRAEKFDRRQTLMREPARAAGTDNG
jgi:hypothetical protein